MRRIEVAVDEQEADSAVEVIVKSTGTVEFGDGKGFAGRVGQTVFIPTEETGEAAN